MGDRANVVVRDSDDLVYLYTHWSGYDLAPRVRDALARKERWDDIQYLTRIVFESLVGDDTGGTSGFGISSTIHDNERPILVVDCDAQKVLVASEGTERTAGVTDASRWASFSDFAAFTEEQARAFHLEAVR